MCNSASGFHRWWDLHAHGHLSMTTGRSQHQWIKCSECLQQLQHRWRDAGASTGHVIKTRHHTMRITITPPSHQPDHSRRVPSFYPTPLHTPMHQPQTTALPAAAEAFKTCQAALLCFQRHLARKRHLPSVLKQASSDSPKHTMDHAPRMCTHTKVSTAYHAAPRAPCTPTNHQ